MSCSIVATAPPLHLPCGRVGGGLGTEPASVDRQAAASRRDGRGGVACRGGGGHRWVRDRRSIYAPMSSTGPISVLCPLPKGLQIAWRQRRRRCLWRQQAQSAATVVATFI